MYKIIAGVDYLSGICNGNVRLDFQDSIHCLSNYGYLPLYRAAETGIFTKRPKFLGPGCTEHIYIVNRSMYVN